MNREMNCTTLVNDINCFIVNFWRAVQHDPDAVAFHAKNPINEIDYHARHSYLYSQEPRLRTELESNPYTFDAELAGWWVWGQCIAMLSEIVLPKIGTRKEAAILAAMRISLPIARWYVVRIHQSLGSMPGIADLCAMRDGRVVWIEAKSEGRSKWSVDQQKFARSVEHAGCEYRIVRTPEDFADMMER